MTRTRSIIFVYIILLLIQVVINDFLNVFPRLYICLIPLGILFLPHNTATWKIMLYGFFLGLLVDVTSNGVLGLNAAPAVLLAVMRTFLYSLLVNKDTSDKKREALFNNVPFGKFSRFIFISIFIYMTCYLLIDNSIFVSPVFFATKLLISLTINSLICIAAYLLFRNRRVEKSF